MQILDMQYILICIFRNQFLKFKIFYKLSVGILFVNPKYERDWLIFRWVNIFQNWLCE